MKQVRAEYGALQRGVAVGETPILSPDITADPNHAGSAAAHWVPQGCSPLRSYLAVPVISRSGEILGSLVFGHSQAGTFSERDAGLVTGIAAQAAIALDNARLFSESQKAQEALRLSNQELQRANADLEQFAFAAAHDLQEPLRMVSSYTQLLERSLKGQLDARTGDYLEFVVGGAKRMSQLLQDLLAYTEAGRGADIAPAPVDLNRVLRQSLRNLDAAIADSAAEIGWVDLPPVIGREAHFLQIFQNLIGNSIKYARRGSTRLHLGGGKRGNGCTGARFRAPASVWQFASAWWSAREAGSGWSPHRVRARRSALQCPGCLESANMRTCQQASI